MTYICVKCQRTWVMDEPTDYVSGGICRECITSYIRSKQIKAGSDACFGEPDECNELQSCKYGQWCVTQYLIAKVSNTKMDANILILLDIYSTYECNLVRVT